MSQVMVIHSYTYRYKLPTLGLLLAVTSTQGAASIWRLRRSLAILKSGKSQGCYRLQRELAEHPDHEQIDKADRHKR
jgi:hypothetical protein